MKKQTKGKVLVIEDDDILRKTLRHKLKDSGYTVVEAANGEEGLAALKQNPELILLDMYMPKMDGLQFLQALSTEPLYKDTPIIIVTVSRHKSDAASTSKTANVVGTLIKSDISLDEVVAKVAVTLKPAPVTKRTAKNN